MNNGFWVIICLIIWALGWMLMSIYEGKWKDIENQAIEKGYAEIRVINGERKFQWK